MRQLLICIAFLVTIIGSLVLYIRFASIPPKEVKFISDFHDHRAAFEELKNMLISEHDLDAVAPWGIRTSQGFSKPPAGSFPVDRYNHYLALLQQVDGAVAYRDDGEYGIGLWGSGFAGDTQHIGICWQDREPTEQISSLDDHIKRRMHGEKFRRVYQHLDGNWYLYTDW